MGEIDSLGDFAAEIVVLDGALDLLKGLRISPSSVDNLLEIFDGVELHGRQLRRKFTDGETTLGYKLLKSRTGDSVGFKNLLGVKVLGIHRYSSLRAFALDANIIAHLHDRKQPVKRIFFYKCISCCNCNENHASRMLSASMMTSFMASTASSSLIDAEMRMLCSSAVMLMMMSVMHPS